ncbi:hypothetical protein SASPL_116168 [Salvia splendens]|uniref:DUF7963 domain-containing protein n=1 Tax=Salvia splendens TaxID=180675 RepID=A0A8X8Y7Y7_SALSN|nr:hypothetical protein SASPL_116168 [Salvia splendens]
MSNANPSPPEAAEDAVNKRYARLLSLRTKAVDGKGAWYWAHFDPILIRNPDTNLAKSVKLNRITASALPWTCEDDLRPLAMLEESVKKLKSPNSPPSHVLRKEQVDAAFDLLADWYYEVCGSVAFSSLEHPMFAAFLRQVGLPEVSKRELLCSRLDSKFEEARRASEARIRDAAFFQIASDGWNIIDRGSKSLVKFVVNLPNGTRVFQKAVYSNGGAVEEVLWETVGEICCDNAQRCVGIIADRYKGKALKRLELQNTWMVNLSCQIHGFCSLIKDFNRELPLFGSVAEIV